MRYPFISLFLLFLLGCATVDLVQDHSNICSVHGEEMKVKKLRIHPGYEGYAIEYYNKMLAEFPNYDGARWGHVDYIFGARWVNAYVCENLYKAVRGILVKKKRSGTRKLNCTTSRFQSDWLIAEVL